MSVRVEWEANNVASVVLAWPDRRNALGPAEASEVADALREANTAQVVVLRAEGAAFCAGGDLDAIASVAADGREAVRSAIYGAFHAMARGIRGLRGISIAAVDGPAVGLGADLALLCNVRFVGPEGWMDQGWARIGLIPGTGGAWVVSRLAGDATAWDFATSSGTRWDAERLERHGLAIAAEGSAATAALARAKTVARWPAETVAAYRDLLRPTVESFDEHLERCLEYQSTLLTSGAFTQLAARALGRAAMGS